MNPYQKEQWEGYSRLREHLAQMTNEDLDRLRTSCEAYIRFRHDLDDYLSSYFGEYCTQSCFHSSISACCSKDGIITFWADLVINALHSTRDQLDKLMQSIQRPFQHNKCIYLGPQGCIWQIRPLVCALFLCDDASEKVFSHQPEASRLWQDFKEKGRSFRWPDRPVLFDDIEHCFIALGCRSPLMYLNSSPGLLRVKQKAGLPAQRVI